MKNLPPHLRKYIVEQDYSMYTPVDQAVWRFILRRLKNFLKDHAHPSYLSGLEETGISSEEIPRISEISKKLENFGWRALPVSGFIPPAAFMELQSLAILPIACNMRSLQHLQYTPAPDIVHEAAGHAPMLINADFAKYLREYAQVARKAIINKQDLQVYEAIRELSDLKENADSSAEQIAQAQARLDDLSRANTLVSEGAQLARMNWWTAEYGLIGDLQHPQIFGAGLLSSVGESEWCLQPQVKKLPLSIDCLQFAYDITEPQPQLFVTPDFKSLAKVLQQMAQTMAYHQGGLESLHKAIQAQTVNTVQLNSGLQISGCFVATPWTAEAPQPLYLQTQGPTQLAYGDQELAQHSVQTHGEGFSTPLGAWKKAAHTCPCLLTDQDLQTLGIIAGQQVTIEFTSEVQVQGHLQSTLRRNGKLLLLSFKDCTVRAAERVLFQPQWGTFDMAVGSQLVSVYAGPADSAHFGHRDDFIATQLGAAKLSAQEMQRHHHYSLIRQWRQDQQAKKSSSQESKIKFSTLIPQHLKLFPEDWLFLLEAYELLVSAQPASPFAQDLLQQLQALSLRLPTMTSCIEDGIRLTCVPS